MLMGDGQTVLRYKWKVHTCTHTHTHIHTHVHTFGANRGRLRPQMQALEIFHGQQDKAQHKVAATKQSSSLQTSLS
eukprot:1160218-Pelagomonas_calceolata.AAC.16